MNESAIPSGAIESRATPVFTSSSVPAALLAAHKTSVWAELVVTAGSVVFVDEESDEQVIVDAGTSWVIVPMQLHHVEPREDSAFFVQFYTC